MATTSYASVIYYFLHVASPRSNEAKYFIISHIACCYTCKKTHSSFNFIALLFVPRLSEYEPPGAFGTLKAGVRVSRVARYYNCHASAIQHLRDCYQATRSVKGQNRPCQLRMIFVPAGYQHCQTNSRAQRVICFRFFIKIFYFTIAFKSCPISRQISNCSFRIEGYRLLIN